jgi:hypothetical protein
MEMNRRDAFALQSRPDLSAEYLIEEIRCEGLDLGRHLTPNEEQILRLSMIQAASLPPVVLQNVNYRCVDLMRSRIERAKADGTLCYQARRGLRVPVIIEQHYQILFKTNYDAMISAVMQNVFFGNPGEKPWRSPKGTLIGRRHL